MTIQDILFHPAYPVNPSAPFVFAVCMYTTEATRNEKLPDRGFAFLWPEGLPASWLEHAKAAFPYETLDELLSHALLGRAIHVGLLRALRSSSSDDIYPHMPAATMHPAREAQCFLASISVDPSSKEEFDRFEAVAMEFLLRHSSALLGKPIVILDVLLTWDDKAIPREILAKLEMETLNFSANTAIRSESCESDNRRKGL